LKIIKYTYKGINRVTVLFISILIITSTSCKNINNHTDELIIAKAYDKQLTLSDLQKVMPENIKGTDSINFVQNFINGWIKNQIILHKAELNFTGDYSEIEKKLEEYRKSLIIYNYEQQLLEQKLDTVVTPQEIEKYYNENKDDFTLKENIVKVIYVKVNNTSPKLKNVAEWYKLKKPKDREQLESFCLQYAENYYLDDSSWLLFNDLLKEIPIKTYNQENFLQNNRYIEMRDSVYSYFVNIIDFKIKNSTSPLTFEKENIKNILLNKRKILFLEKMQEDLFKEAQKNNEFEIYTNP
jgi:hypothetical protein